MEDRQRRYEQQCCCQYCVFAACNTAACAWLVSAAQALDAGATAATVASGVGAVAFCGFTLFVLPNVLIETAPPPPGAVPPASIEMTAR